MAMASLWDRKTTRPIVFAQLGDSLWRAQFVIFAVAEVDLVLVGWPNNAEDYYWIDGESTAANE